MIKGSPTLHVSTCTAETKSAMVGGGGRGPRAAGGADDDRSVTDLMGGERS